MEQTNRQGCAKLAFSRFIEPASLQPRSHEVQFSLRHGSLESQQELVVEVGGVVTPVLVDNQCAAQRGQFQQTMPIRAASRQPRGFQREDRPDLTHRDIGHQHLKVLTRRIRRGARLTEVAVHDADEMGKPAQFSAFSCNAYCLCVLS